MAPGEWEKGDCRSPRIVLSDSVWCYKKDGTTIPAPWPGKKPVLTECDIRQLPYTLMNKQTLNHMKMIGKPSRK